MATTLAGGQKTRIAVTKGRKAGRKIFIADTPYRERGFRSIPVVRCNQPKCWERDFNGLWCDEASY